MREGAAEAVGETELARLRLEVIAPRNRPYISPISPLYLHYISLFVAHAVLPSPSS